MSSLHLSVVRKTGGGLSVLLVCTLAFAAPTTPVPAEPAAGIAISARDPALAKGDTAMSDESFSREAALVNLGELELARLALERSRNLRVKLLADRVVKDRTSIKATLHAIAKRKNVKLPEKLDVEQQAAVSTLKLQSDGNFDTAYVMQIREDNVKTIALFEQAKSNESLSPDVRKMAGEGLKLLLAIQQQTLSIEVPVKPVKAVTGDSA